MAESLKIQTDLVLICQDSVVLDVRNEEEKSIAMSIRATLLQ